MAGSPEMLAKILDPLKRSMAVRIVAGIAVVAAIGFAVMRFMPQDDSAASGTTATAASVASDPGPDAPAPASPATVPAAPAASAARVAQPVSQASRPAAGEGSGAPVVTAMGQPTAAPATPAHLDEHLTYQYNALGRRDPFQSLVDGQFVGADVGGDAPPDPGGIRVVGIVWGATDQFALVEDVRGNSFVLRKGDKMQNGVVAGLKRDAMIVNITAEGQSQSVEIPLVRKGDQNVR